MATFDELKQASRRPRASVSLCLRGDLLSERQRLAAELQALAKAADEDTLAGDPRIETVQARLAALEQESRESTFEFVFEAVPGAQFRELEDAHPSDENANYSDEFLTELTIACLVEPLLTREQFAELDFTSGQLDALQHTAMQVNRDTSLPFAVAG